jgi:hypothetical protein
VIAAALVSLVLATFCVLLGMSLEDAGKRFFRVRSDWWATSDVLVSGVLALLALALLLLLFWFSLSPVVQP